MSSTLDVSAPDRRIPGLLLFRWVLLLVLLFGELLVMTWLYEKGTREYSGRWWTDSRWALLVFRHPAALRLVVVTAAVMLLFCGKRFIDEVRQLRGRAGRQVWLFVPVLGHLLAFAALAGFTWALFKDGVPILSTSARTVAWAGLVGASTLSWGWAVLPARSWARLLRSGWPALLASLGIGVLAVSAGRLVDELWRPLGWGTLWLVRGLVALIGADVVYVPDQMHVGTASFSVEIAPQCSGYQGVALIWMFLTVYLWLYRDHLRFPQVLWLFPIGTVVGWSANVIRIFLLILLGTWILADLAVSGFHSVAGWLAFNAIALGMVVWTQRSRLFTNAAVTDKHGSPAGAYLLPFLALVLTGLVTAALTSGFDHLYPLRVLVVVAVLAMCWRHYSDLRWGCPGLAALGGLLVFALWVTLESGGGTDDTTGLAAHLASLPTGVATGWLVFRTIGYVVTVPIAEELAFRGYLMRRLNAAEFERVAPKDCNWLSVLISSLAFGALHGRWFAGTLAGLVYALVFARRGKIVDAVIAHATTNALLAVYVLVTGRWALWS